MNVTSLMKPAARESKSSPTCRDRPGPPREGHAAATRGPGRECRAVDQSRRTPAAPARTVSPILARLSGCPTSPNPAAPAPNTTAPKAEAIRARKGTGTTPIVLFSPENSHEAGGARAMNRRNRAKHPAAPGAPGTNGPGPSGPSPPSSSPNGPPRSPSSPTRTSPDPRVRGGDHKTARVLHDRGDRGFAHRGCRIGGIAHVDPAVREVFGEGSRDRALAQGRKE